MTIELNRLLLVADLGYSIVYRKGRFKLEPPDYDEDILRLVWQLKDELNSKYMLMKVIKDWASDDRRRWESLRDIVKKQYEDIYPITPRGTLLTWTGQHVSSLYKDNISADHSFWARAIEKVEERVPEALARDIEITELFINKVMR